MQPRACPSVHLCSYLINYSLVILSLSSTVETFSSDRCKSGQVWREFAKKEWIMDSIFLDELFRNMTHHEQQQVIEELAYLLPDFSDNVSILDEVALGCVNPTFSNLQVYTT